jgi:hypothetical protein
MGEQPIGLNRALAIVFTGETPAQRQASVIIENEILDEMERIWPEIEAACLGIRLTH